MNYIEQMVDRHLYHEDGAKLVLTHIWKRWKYAISKENLEQY